MFLIESLRVFARIENDRRRARSSRSILKFSQDKTAEAASSGFRVNRHKTDLSLSRTIEMQASDGDGK